MILNVNLPTKKEDSIDLSEINQYYNGILIIFIKDICVGFIIFDNYDDTWNIYNDISLTNDAILNCDRNYVSLIKLVEELTHKYGNTFSIKAIPFNEIKK